MSHAQILVTLSLERHRGDGHRQKLWQGRPGWCVCPSSVLFGTRPPRPPVTPAGAVSSEPQSCVPLAEASPSPGTHWVYVGRLGVREGQLFIAYVTTAALHAVQADLCNRNDSPRYKVQCSLSVINGEEPGAGGSQFRGREKGREEDGGQKCLLLSQGLLPSALLQPSTPSQNSSRRLRHSHHVHSF